MTWAKLEVGNNWGALFYAYPGELINSSGTNATENELELRAGISVAVRFPDGWGSVVELSGRLERFSFFDMGRECSGETTRWGFEFEVHGLPVWIPIEQVEMAVGSLRRKRDQREGSPK